MIISIDKEKTFDKIQYPFVTTLNIRSRKELPQTDKGHLQKNAYS